jgi:hypothetical protein
MLVALSRRHISSQYTHIEALSTTCMYYHVHNEHCYYFYVVSKQAVKHAFISICICTYTVVIFQCRIMVLIRIQLYMLFCASLHLFGGVYGLT